jgi:predicted RNA-binding protein associated with RNAse of E/G family
LGGPENVKRKIQSIAHVEFDIPEITSEENIKASIDSCKDVLNRPGKSYKVLSLDNYPEYLKSLMVEYPQFIKDVS